MKKRLITLAVAAAFAAPLTAQAAPGDVDVTGFADIIYTITDESSDGLGVNGDNTTEKKFTADGEVDFIASPVDGVTARIDIDLDLAGNGGGSLGGDSGRIEQAFFAWNINQGPLTFVGGVFNNPIGQDPEDAPDIYMTSHTAVYNILDNQTALNGNNITGVALAAGAGMFTGTVAILNDLQQTDEENSFALVLGAMPMPDMELEFGYVTQENDDPLAGGAGNVWDINGSWAKIAGSGFDVGFDYFDSEELIDGAWNVRGGFSFGSGFSVKARYESVAFDVANAPDDSTAFSLYGSWQARSNLLIALEYKAGETDSSALDGVTGIFDGDLITAEFIATLP